MDISRSLRLEARGLEKIVPVAGGLPRKLLDNISPARRPGNGSPSTSTPVTAPEWSTR